MKKQIIAAATAAAAALAVSSAGAADIELKLGHFLPTANGIHNEFLEPWSKDLEACSQGKVKVTIYPAGTQFGNIAKLYDSVRAGVIDMAHGLRGIPNGRFPKTSIIELPFMTGSADAASKALWAAYPKYLADEYPGVKVLALHAHNGGLIHTSSKAIKTMDDLKGLRIRFPSGPIKALLESLGATAQGLPPGKVYESLQKGVIDGTVFPWDPMNSFKLAEVTNHHTDIGGIYTVSFWFAMNEKTYAGLPDDVKACVDNSSGANLAGRFGAWWDGWDKLGHDKSVATGAEMITLSDAEKAKWRAAAQPVTDAWLKDLESQGVTNAREIYDFMKAEIKKAGG